MTFRLPGPQHRLTVSGSTGTGKSQYAMGVLSTCDYPTRPWVIIDPKRDDLIAAVRPTEIERGEKPPREPGLYVIHPKFGDPADNDWLEYFLAKIWEQEHTGVYVDEGYMIPNNSKAFLALLTQGRSKYIQMIMCSQRPVRCHPMMFSESDFLCAFRLNKPADRETIQEYMSIDTKKRLPEFYSYWYDVGKNKGFVLTPGPSRDEIIASFRRRLKRGVGMI